MADRIVVLHRGVVQQVGKPEELYRSPKNRFVARFIGTPAMNLIKGVIDANRFIGGPIAAPVTVAHEGPAILGVRPEHVIVRPSGHFEGTIVGIEPVGESGYLHLDVTGLDLDAEAGKRALLCVSVPGRDAFTYREGATVKFDFTEDRLVVFHPEKGDRLG